MQTDTSSQIDRTISGTTVRILRNVEEIESVREFWSSTPGILDTDIDVFLARPASIPEGLQLRVLVLYRGGKPVALMAGSILRERFVFRLGWFPLFKPRVNVFTIRGGLRGDASSENCQELVHMILKCLKKGEADLVFLPGVEADSALFHCLKSEPGFLFRDHFTPIRLRRRRELPGSVEELYASLSHNARMIFRRIAKRLNNEFPGQVRMERVDRFETSTDLYGTLAVVDEIAKKTWQRTMSAGLHMTVSQLEAFKKQAERGWLRIYILYLADKPAAFWLGALYRRIFFAEYTGYDSDYAGHSLGTYMLARMMEEFCSEGVEAIDFAASDEEYKKRYSNAELPETDLHLFAPSLTGLTLSAMATIRVLLHEPARAFLKRTNLTQRVKKIWRRVRTKRERIGEARA